MGSRKRRHALGFFGQVLFVSCKTGRVVGSVLNKPRNSNKELVKKINKKNSSDSYYAQHPRSPCAGPTVSECQWFSYRARLLKSLLRQGHVWRRTLSNASRQVGLYPPTCHPNRREMLSL